MSASLTLNASQILPGDEKTNFALELTYNYGKDGPEAYNIGKPSCRPASWVQSFILYLE